MSRIQVKRPRSNLHAFLSEYVGRNRQGSLLRVVNPQVLLEPGPHIGVNLVTADAFQVTTRGLNVPRLSQPSYSRRMKGSQSAQRLSLENGLVPPFVLPASLDDRQLIATKLPDVSD